MELTLYGKYLIDLIKAAFNGTEPSESYENVDFSVLFELSIMHNIANLLYEPLSKLENVDKETLEKFKVVYHAKIANDTIQTYYLEKITDLFEKNAVPYSVMKGPVIKKLYPRPDYRQSGDLDIFVDEKYREEARAIMEGIGFQIERYNLDDADDVYFIDKKIHVELHRILVSNKTPWQEECQKITDRLILTEGKKYSYEMSLEDYYLYTIAHMAKHMKYSGMGIKMVLDVWVYINKYRSSLDWDVLKHRLDCCGLTTFEENIRKLTNYWFNNGESDEIIKDLSNYILLSGTFGTQKQLKMCSMAEKSQNINNRFVFNAVYYTKFFFQPYEWMCGRYPVLRKLPFLLPFCWIHRAVKTILFDREKAKRIASEYDGVEIDESKKVQEFKRKIGL
ncbi:MAG: nucleotidyltransferase family protein [Clostridia bacterium]|nr:nucleotidyltransferase family protein [Clostridia bacterium]